MLQRRMIGHFLGTFRHIGCGSIRITMPDRSRYEFSGKEDGPDAELTIYDIRAVAAFTRKGDIGFAESYRDGWWDSKNLTVLFSFGLKNEGEFDSYINGSFAGRMASRFAYFFTRNTLRGSKRNIHAHYDLGNDFYKLWLDPGMTYSSALFEDSTEDLASAQRRKYDRIIDRLDGSGTLLEIGCGWGGFAERALARRDYAIKGLTISRQQHDYAATRLKGNAVISLEDYRLQTGKYDQIVSIEMFEAVGERFWPVYFSRVKSLLADKGRAVIQTITIGDRYFKCYRTSGDPVRTFIFPGGMLPSPERFVLAARKAGLVLTDRFAFGKDYVLTLRAWLDRFEQCPGKVRALGFDDKFIRMWRFYLTYCIAGFEMDRTDVMQMELRHAA